MFTNIFLKKQTFTAIGLFLFQFTFCQENYLPGYIIRSNNDTLHGFIDYRNWERNPDKTNFRKTPGEKEITYTPVDIKGLGVKDEVYQSAIIKKEISADNLNDLQFSSELVFETDTVFLQTVISGEKSLYFYSDNYGREQFYIKINSKYELLIHKKYLTIADGPYGKQDVVAENTKYMGQLAFYLQDCQSIQKYIRGLKYNKKNLEDLFIEYYNCTKSKIKFQKKTEKLSFESGLLAGVLITTLQLGSDYYEYLDKAVFQKSLNFMPGIFLNIILPRNNGKWSLCNELTYTPYKIKGRYDIHIDDNYYTNNYLTIGYAYLKMNNMLRFKYPIGKLFVYANGGVSSGYSIHEINIRKKETKTPYSADPVIVESKAIDKPKKFEIGYLFGLGANFKKYSVEIRNEKSDGMANSIHLGSATNRLYFILGFRF
jgi:hypothetical protein